MPIFKFKVTFTTEKNVEANDVSEARGILKGMALVQMQGFTLERADIMQPDVKTPVKKIA